MKKRRKFLKVHDSTFKNGFQRNMSLDDVFQNVIEFMKKDPAGNYEFIIGTDSQVHGGYTKFVTAVAIVRKEGGNWPCYRTVYVDRAMELREKIFTEGSYSQEIAGFFDDEKISAMIDIMLPFIDSGASFEKKIHFDVGNGKKNKTRKFVEDVKAMAKAMGYDPVIKPDAYLASGYANKLTK